MATPTSLFSGIHSMQVHLSDTITAAAAALDRSLFMHFSCNVLHTYSDCSAQTRELLTDGTLHLIVDGID